MKTFVVIVALTLCACTTQRPKPNLAIEAEPSTPPPAEQTDTTQVSSDERPPAGEIELGLEGSSGSIQVEGAMSAAEEEEALAAENPKKDDKKKKDGDGDGDEDEESADEETEEEE